MFSTQQNNNNFITPLKPNTNTGAKTNIFGTITNNNLNANTINNDNNFGLQKHNSYVGNLYPDNFNALNQNNQQEQKKKSSSIFSCKCGGDNIDKNEVIVNEKDFKNPFEQTINLDAQTNLYLQQAQDAQKEVEDLQKQNQLYSNFNPNITNSLYPQQTLQKDRTLFSQNNIFNDPSNKQMGQIITNPNEIQVSQYISGNQLPFGNNFQNPNNQTFNHLQQQQQQPYGIQQQPPYSMQQEQPYNMQQQQPNSIFQKNVPQFQPQQGTNFLGGTTIPYQQQQMGLHQTNIYSQNQLNTTANIIPGQFQQPLPSYPITQGYQAGYPSNAEIRVYLQKLQDKLKLSPISANKAQIVQQ